MHIMVFIRAAKVQTPFGAHNPQFWVKRAPFSPERYPHVAMNGEWAGRNCPPSGGNAHRSGFRLFAKGRTFPRDGTFAACRSEAHGSNVPRRKSLGDICAFLLFSYLCTIRIGRILLRPSATSCCSCRPMGVFHRIFTPPSPSLLPCPSPLFSLSVPSSP